MTLLATILLPMLGAVCVVPLARVSEKVRDVTLLCVCVACTVLTASFIPRVLAGGFYEAHLLRMTPTIWLMFRVDAAGLTFACATVVLWVLAMLYSVGYMADEHKRDRYYAFLMLSLGWTLGVAFAGNLLTLLVFYELFSILTYPLIVHEETPEALAAGTKYIIYVLIGGSLVMLAVVVTYFIAPRDSLAGTGVFGPVLNRTALTALFWCYIAGFGVKAAIVPLHGWVPDAHPAAPAPFSAILSGVLVAAGSFCIIRVLFNVFGVELVRQLGLATPLALLAAFTVLFGAVLAINQDNLKRRLAYSTISQMGYVVLGAALLGQTALVGSLLQIANHAFIKGALFLCAGVFFKRGGLRDVSRMRGIAARFPVTTATFTVASLAMIGTPPLSGFISKWFLGTGVVEAGQPLYLIVLLGGALIAATYLLPIVYHAYFSGPPATEASTGDEATPLGKQTAEAGWLMLAPLVVATVLTVLLGIAAAMPGLPLSLARVAADKFVP
jgi:multicomponent Na+:H+ antiporter subunit D